MSAKYPEMGYTMIWQAQATKRALKASDRMPWKAHASFWLLHAVLKAQGPAGSKEWKNLASSKVATRSTTATSRGITSGSRVGWRMVTRSPLKSSTSAVIKACPIELSFRAEVPRKVLEDIRSIYGFWLESSPDDDELVDLSQAPKWKAWQASRTPGSWLSGLREAQGWTQRELGERLGGVSPARISDWEHDRRAISKEVAKQLSVLLHVSVACFL